MVAELVLSSILDLGAHAVLSRALYFTAPSFVLCSTPPSRDSGVIMLLPPFNFAVSSFP